MNNVDLSKSKYCNAICCEKLLWLNKYKPECATETDNTSSFENGKRVGELAKSLFGDYEDIGYDKNKPVMIEKTDRLLKEKPNIITEASFMYDNNFCRVDILKNDLDGVEIYEVKSSTEVKDTHLDDAAYQYYVLSNLELNVKKVCIVYLNKEYVRGKELNIRELFNIADITQIVKDKQMEIKSNIDYINRFMTEYGENDEPESRIDIKCIDPDFCPYWEHCSRDLPKPNVFDIVGMNKSKKIEKYNENKISFEDLQNEDLNPKYLEQIDFELNDRKPKIEKEAINKTMVLLKYPLYFIDYETYNTPIPEIEGTRPYQPLPFQYSLHILKDENAELEHKEFLAESDDKEFIRHFAENLIKDLSEDGSVIIYSNYEHTINNNISNRFPDLEEDINRINSNLVDFLPIFKQHNYYMKEMNGSASIKDVLPALCPELDYSKLPLIHKGDEASEAFKSLKNKNHEEQEEIRDALLQYCELDTYAMVKIYEKFKEIMVE